MKRIYNVNVGLSWQAKKILEEKKDESFTPVVNYRTGPNNSIELLKYKLKDGSFAKEFVQNVSENNEKQSLYFIAINIENKYFTWSAEDMAEKINQKYYE